MQRLSPKSTPVRPKSGSGYSNFRFVDKTRERVLKLTGCAMGVFFVLTFVNFRWFKDKWLTFLESFKASALENGYVREDESACSDDAFSRQSFRDRKVIAYENRIRMFSSANKVFRYFASVKIPADGSNPSKHGEIFMTPYDFLRSLTPGMTQPEGLGLEQYRTVDQTRLRKARIVDELFSKNLLISFPEYVFLLTVLSASPDRFAIAFKMFDLDGDGMLDYREFNKIQTIVRRLESKLQSYARERAPLKADSSFAVYLFGDRLDRKISLQEFLNFREQLLKAVLQVEFELLGPDDSDTISAENFARMILARADLSEASKEVVVGRLLETLRSSKMCRRVTFQDVEDFFLLLSRLEELETALRIYRLAESSVDRTTLKRVISFVTDRPAPEFVVDILFAMFDANGDGALAHEEFIEVMKSNVGFGLASNRTPRLTSLFDALRKCLVWQFQLAMSRWCEE